MLCCLLEHCGPGFEIARKSPLAHSVKSSAHLLRLFPSRTYMSQHWLASWSRWLPWPTLAEGKGLMQPKRIKLCCGVGKERKQCWALLSLSEARSTPRLEKKVRYSLLTS